MEELVKQSIEEIKPFLKRDGGDIEFVELTPENLMLPHKSCSAIYFESEQPFENCAYCPRPNCPNRRARFVRLAGQ